MRVYNHCDKATVMGVFIQLKAHILTTNGTDIRIYTECLDLAITGNNRDLTTADITLFISR